MQWTKVPQMYVVGSENMELFHLCSSSSSSSTSTSSTSSSSLIFKVPLVCEFRGTFMAL